MFRTEGPEGQAKISLKAGIDRIEDITSVLGWTDDIIESVLAQSQPKQQVIDIDIPQIRTHLPYRNFMSVSFDMRHNTVGHTIDDSLLVDRQNGIYIVADGVTREFCTDQNAAWQVAQAFTRLMHWHISVLLLECNNPNYILRQAFHNANLDIAKINRHLELGSDFLENAPASCAAAVLFRHGEDYFMGNIADSQVVSFENYPHSQQIKQITPIQTLASETIREKEPTKEKMLERHRACANQITTQGDKESYAYGIINGNPNAVHFFETKQAAHRTPFLIYSDGFYNLCGPASGNNQHQERAATFASLITNPEYASYSADRLIDTALRQTPNPSKLDDISLIIVTGA